MKKIGLFVYLLGFVFAAGQTTNITSSSTPIPSPIQTSPSAATTPPTDGRDLRVVTETKAQ